jgi:hypothetical protein
MSEEVKGLKNAGTRDMLRRCATNRDLWFATSSTSPHPMNIPEVISTTVIERDDRLSLKRQYTSTVLDPD